MLVDVQSTDDWENNPLECIKAQTRIKLRHISTEKHLHSHDHRPPVSDVDEVSAYGMAGFLGDANDDWYVEIDQHMYMP
jgi:dolichyl-phosphate-mannose-protein mannosyltransferase